MEVCNDQASSQSMSQLGAFTVAHLFGYKQDAMYPLANMLSGAVLAKVQFCSFPMMVTRLIGFE